jgi:hypothetical protein
MTLASASRADLYPRLPLTNKSRGRNPKDLDVGKVHVETLYDALWLIDMAQGADLIWSQLSRAEQRRLRHTTMARLDVLLPRQS